MGYLTALANERFSAMSHFEIVKKNGNSGYLFFYNPGILPCKVVHKSETVLFVCFFYFPGRPVTVYIDVYIVDIGEISVTNMVRFVFMYFTVMKAEKLNAKAIKTLRDDTQHI